MEKSAVRARVARILIALQVLGAIVAFIGWLVQRGHGQHATFLEVLFNILNIPVSYSLPSAVVLAIIAGVMVRRKRIGWWAAVVQQLLGIYLGAFAGFGLGVWAPLEAWIPSAMSTVADIISVPVGIAMLVVLWWVRPEFPGQLRKGSGPQALLTLIVGLGITVGVTALLVSTRAPGVPVWEGTWAVLGRSAGLSANHSLLASMPHWLPVVAGLLFVVTVLGALLVFLYGAKDPNRWTPEQERELRGLLARFGAPDSLGYFATRRDKSAVFSENREAAVTYRVIQGVCLASADPIGDPRHWPDAIGAWLAVARRYGWIPAVDAASEAGARAYVASGLKLMRMGDEAVVHERALTQARASNPQLRRAVRHVADAGVTIQVQLQEQMPPEELEEVVRSANDWRHGKKERGFSMALGREADPADGKIVHVTARTAEGKLVGLLSFVPWGTAGLSLDVMRRSPEAPHGVTEAMITGLVESGRMGARQVSLNFCMGRRTFAESEQFGSSTVERLSGSVLGLMDRFWQLERLYRSNRQYDPAWVPRYFLYQDVVSLAHVGIALGMGEGFIPEPRIKNLEQPTLTPEQAAFVGELESPEVDHALFEPHLTPDERHRLEKLRTFEEAGGEGYPAVSSAPSDRLGELAELADEEWEEGRRVSTAGRVRHVRDHGEVAFVDLIDGGHTIQLRLQHPKPFLHAVDAGDLVGIGGTLAHSNTGDRVVDTNSWGILAKSLHRIRFEGWTDPQARAHNRSEDLLTRPEGMASLQTRSKVVAAVRETLLADGFWEVETPVLHQVHGGASARPFHTHLNAYSQDLSLRIAPELYLKRLLVAGTGPIFEISRNFRNEGVDSTHNPEFTSVEAYRPFADYHDMRRLTQELVRAAATATHGEPVLHVGEESFDLRGDWPVVPVLEAVSGAVDHEVHIDDDPELLAGLADRFGVDVDPAWGAGHIIEELYGELVEATTRQPTFYVDFPAETSPLTRPHRSKRGLVERWDLVVAGMELGTAYTELTDPRIQRDRLVRQSLAAAAGDPEAMEVDEDFLRALELGMPPTGGLGIGMDRLVMLMTGEQIRGVLSFPFTRANPKQVH